MTIVLKLRFLIDYRIRLTASRDPFQVVRFKLTNPDNYNFLDRYGKYPVSTQKHP